jgi:hypothetical protein
MVLGTEVIGRSRNAALYCSRAQRRAMACQSEHRCSKLLQCDGCHGVKFVAAANEEEIVVYFL